MSSLPLEDDFKKIVRKLQMGYALGLQSKINLKEFEALKENKMDKEPFM